MRRATPKRQAMRQTAAMNRLADQTTAAFAARCGGPTAYAKLRWDAVHGTGETREQARFTLRHRDYWTWERRQVYYATLDAQLAGRELCELVRIGVRKSA